MTRPIVSPQTDRRPGPTASGWFATPYGALYLVAAGSGGALRGFAAADFAARSLPRLLARAAQQRQSAPAALQASLQALNETLHRFHIAGPPALRGMSASLAAALHERGGFWTIRAGAGRLYAYGERGLEPLDEEADPPALGVAANMTATAAAEPLTLVPGQGLLLTDARLIDYVGAGDLARAIESEPDKRRVADRMLAGARQRGGESVALYLHLPDPEPAAAAKPVQPSPAQPSPSARRARPADPAPAEAVPPLTADQIQVARRRRQLARAAVIVALVITVFHYQWLFRFRPYAPPSAEPIAAATDIDRRDDYASWSPEPCSMSVVEQAKAFMGEFEAELSRGATMTYAEEREKAEPYVAEITALFEGKIDTQPLWAPYFQEIGRELAQAGLERTEVDYRFYFVDDPLENAFALPGGHIFVFRGLLDGPIRNEAELAFVLAHEMIHVDRGHSFAIMRVIEALPEPIRNELGGLAGFLMKRAFSMSREEEADFEALKLIIAAGYSPYRAALFMERRAERVDGPKRKGFDLLREAQDLLDTHPNMWRRACQVRNQAIALLGRVEDEVFYIGVANYRDKISMVQKKY